MAEPEWLDRPGEEAASGSCLVRVFSRELKLK
jgi:hypothetical protein